MRIDPDSMFGRMYQQVTVILGLTTAEQKMTWQYILVEYCRLEALALELLRLHTGIGDEAYWGSDAIQGKNLKAAATELSQAHLVPQDIIKTLRDVADLRNSVAHKMILGGMTTGSVHYNGAPVFDEEFLTKYLSDPGVSGINEATVEQLLNDISHASTELVLCQQAAVKAKLLRQAAVLKQLPIVSQR